MRLEVKAGPQNMLAILLGIRSIVTIGNGANQTNAPSTVATVSTCEVMHTRIS